MLIIVEMKTYLKDYYFKIFVPQLFVFGFVVSIVYLLYHLILLLSIEGTKTTRSDPEIPHERQKRFFWLIIFPVVVCLFTSCISPPLSK